ncbi:hypothetical protein [Kitasatospora camelliae]|uniref:Uncharacterized protein n=1 Tax=Kitasatospora camelliae TaxID=3156397 RepID=A0AAU8JVZ7_9ACTN
MAICTACGAASAQGAGRCAACGRPFAAPAIEIDEVMVAGGGDDASPPPLGAWGLGTPHDPAARRSPLARWLASPDWLPALAALAAPTALLLLAALLLADADTVDSFERLAFGDRFAAGLAMALTVLGAPFRSVSETSNGLLGYGTSIEIRLLPYAPALLWLGLLQLGLRLHRRRLATPLDGAAARALALRTALLTAVTTTLLGLLSGVEKAADATLPSVPAGRRRSGVFVTVESDWWQAVVWATLAAGLLALAVYGTDVLRRTAWERAGIRGWLVGALVSARVTAAVVGLGSLAALIAAASQDEAPAGWVYPVLLVNGGLAMLGVGSGATLETASATAALYNDGTDRTAFSLFDLDGQSGHWWWTVLLALLAAGLLGRAAHRRRFDTADRLRLGAVHAVLTLLLLLGAGAGADFATYSGRGSAFPFGTDTRRTATTLFEVGWSVPTVVLAVLLWTAVGALAVPAVLDRVVQRPAPAVPTPPAFAPNLPAQAAPPAPSAPPAVPDPVDPHEAFRKPADS